MIKLYGYKEKDVVNFCNLIKTGGDKKPTEYFKEFSSISKKSKGTARNLYYAIAKLSNASDEFCDKYLDGKKLKINAVTKFDKSVERGIVKGILEGKNSGMSVRKATNVLAKGDQKLALRYQNKYRSVIKNNGKLIEELLDEIHVKAGDRAERNHQKLAVKLITEIQFRRLKNEINNLVLEISKGVKDENDYLRRRVATLERENAKLINELYDDKPNDIIRYFTGGKKGISSNNR